MRKWLKRLGMGLLALPAAAVLLFGAYEGFGMWANHRATGEQTAALRADLEGAIPNVAILAVDQETGNTAGTGNHVDCLSIITFSTELEEGEIRARLGELYRLDGWDCTLERTGDGTYTISLLTPAPFPDNIEGH